MSRIKRTIDTTIGVREFAFTRMFTITGVRYQVSVVNVGNVHTFNMEEAEGAWRIRRSTPPASFLIGSLFLKTTSQTSLWVLPVDLKREMVVRDQPAVVYPIE
jgi:hypothetical protein